MSLVARLSFFLGLILALAIASPVRAQPTNDDFANALVLAGFPTAGSGNSIFGTDEPGEPDHENEDSNTNPGGASIWWTWIAPTTRRVLVDVCVTSFLDPLVSVYTGNAVNALTRLPASVHDGCGLGQARIYDVVAGTTYRIAVDGESAGGGVPDMGSIEIAIRPAPDNDDFADAAIIPGDGGEVTGINLLATKETGEPDHSGVNKSKTSIWWHWTPTVSGLVRLTTCDSNAINTFLAVYTGSAVNALVQVAQNDDSCAGRAALTFPAVMGTTYSIAVDSEFFGTNLVLRLGPPPANDAFAAAEELSGVPATGTAVNALASQEASEPTPTAGTTLWWHWIAPSTGQFTIDTCDSDFDTRLAVFTGTQLNALTLVKGSDDGCGSQSQVTIDAVAGTDYRIQVGGYFNTGLRDTSVLPPAANGTVVLHVTAGAGPPPTGPQGQVDFGVSATSPIAGSGKPSVMGVGDFDEDGTSDIVRASDGEIEVRLGGADCAFTPSSASPIDYATSATPYAMAVGLLNNDAHLDLVLTHSQFLPTQKGALSIFLGDGHGGFTEHADSPIEQVEDFYTPIIANVGGSAANDVVVGSGATANVEMYLGDGTGHLTNFPAGAIDPGYFATRYAAANFGGDATFDLAVGGSLACCSGTGSTVNLWRAVGDGTFDGESSLYTQLSSGNQTSDSSPLILPADLDGDADIDFIAVDVATHVILTNGSFGMTRAEGGTLKHYGFHADPTIVDIDGDHDTDLIGVTSEGLYVLLNDGHAHFTVAETSPEPFTNVEPHALDCDGDQDQDLALLSSAAGALTILVNGGGGGPPVPTPSPTATPVATLTPAPEAPDHCDDCIDNDFDAAVDRADSECPPRADGAAAGVAGGKAVLKCQKAIEKAGAGLATKRMKGLGGCLQKAFACVQNGSDAGCLAKAGAGCAKVEAARAAALAKLTAALGKACGAPPLGSGDLTALAGLGFSAEGTGCADFGVPALATPADVAACLAARAACRAEAMVGTGIPRARALLTLAGRDPALDAPCLPPGGAGTAAADVKRTLKCQKALAKAGAGYAKVRLKNQQKCFDARLACIQLKGGDVGCLAKATTACAKLSGKVSAAGVKLPGLLTKACGDVATVLDTNGVGFDLRTPECAALGSSFATLDGVANCLALEHACRVDQLTLGAAPRANELGAIGF